MPTSLEIQAHEIREQTERICNSSGFRNSNVVRRFLTFVVEETLAGNENQLKEYTIALGVLDKKIDFNPSMDAIVRIHAGRLRKLLRGYYNNQGINDPILIHIPVGRYMPVFERTNTNKKIIHAEPKPQAPSLPVNQKPVLAVLPFVNHSQNPQLDVINFVLSTDLSVELTRFSELAVISSSSSMEASGKTDNRSEIARHLGASYMITGSTVAVGNQIRITVEMHAADSKVELWADSFTMNDEEIAIFTNIAYIIRKVVGIITGHFGILYRYMIGSHTASMTKDYSYANAIFTFYKYHQSYTQESLIEAMTALKAALEKHPDNALIASILGGCIVNLKSVDFQGDFDPLVDGERYLRMSIKLDPNNQYAYKDLAWYYILKHDKNGFHQSMSRAIEINPNNVSVTGDAGWGYIMVGEYEKGLEYLLDAVQLNPYYPWYFNIGFCFYYLHLKEFEEALFYAHRINRLGFYWDPLLKASILGSLGRIEEAAPYVQKILAIKPDFAKRAMEIIGLFLLDEELKQTILTGLIKAGIKTENTMAPQQENKIFKIARTTRKAIG